MRTLLQLVVNGVALGSAYAMVALGFCAIHRATGVVNFAQGAMVLLGAYVVSTATLDHGLPFALAVALGVAAVAAVGALFSLAILSRVEGQPAFAAVMLTIGLNIILVAGVSAVFGNNGRAAGTGDPWGASALHLGGVVVLWDRLWAVVVTLVALAAFTGFDRWTRYGVATRATVADAEAALAAGVPVGRVKALAWALAGALATLAGVFLSASPNVLDPTLSDVALLAFPAVIVGGLDSPAGAVAGGLVTGVVYELVDGYSGSLAFLGHGFYAVAPYAVMVGVLLLRPHGLFGRRPSQRLG